MESWGLCQTQTIADALHTPGQLIYGRIVGRGEGRVVVQQQVAGKNCTVSFTYDVTMATGTPPTTHCVQDVGVGAYSTQVIWFGLLEFNASATPRVISRR